MSDHAERIAFVWVVAISIPALALLTQTGCSSQVPQLQECDVFVGDVLPFNVQFPGSTYQKRNPSGMVVLWEERREVEVVRHPLPGRTYFTNESGTMVASLWGPDDGESHPGRIRIEDPEAFFAQRDVPRGPSVYFDAKRGLYVFTGQSGKITGVQSARKRMIDDKQFALETILGVDVPAELFKPPEKPSPELLAAGDRASRSGQIDPESPPAPDPVISEARADAKKRIALGPFAKGQLDSNLEFLNFTRYAEPRAPSNLAEYLYYFAGLTPEVGLFPHEEDRWRAECDEFLRSYYLEAVLVPVFTFYDLSGITEDGFKRTFHFGWWPGSEVSISHPSGRRIRIEARLHFGKPQQ